MLRLLVLIIFIISMVVAVVLARRRGQNATGTVRRPQKRSLIVRILCGAAATLMLIAVATGTYNDYQESYLADPMADKTIRMPALPAPVLTEVPSGDTRILVHLLVAKTQSDDSMQLVHAEEYLINYPADIGKPFERNFKILGAQTQHKLTIGDMGVNQWGKGNQIWISSSQKLTTYAGMTRMSSSHGRTLGAGLQHISEIDTLRGGVPTSLFSAYHVQNKKLHFFIDAHVLAKDDALLAVKAQETFAALLAQTSKQDSDSWYLTGSPHVRELPALGLNMLLFFGLSMFTLLLAAVLFSQLWTRRTLAFPGMLVAMILFVALLDRVQLSGHLARHRDTARTADERVLAARQAEQDTFFYYTTARNELNEAQDSTRDR